MSYMVKIFWKSLSVKAQNDEEESPSVETAGVQYEEEEDNEQTKLFNENNENNENQNQKDEEDDENVVFIRKIPVHPRDRLKKKTRKRFKCF